MKKVVLTAIFLGVVMMVTSSPAIVFAAGGTSPYITPEPTSYNLDIVGILGAVVYGIGVVIAGYGRVLNSMASRQIA